ncbi:MAG: DUF4349 domain-containing protein [Bacteroidota bacterium]
MKKIIILPVFLFCVFVLHSCSENKQADFGPVMRDEYSMEKADEINSSGEMDRKIIRNANLTIDSKTPSKDRDFILKLAKELNGILLREYENHFEYADEIVLTLKVPASNFDKFLDSLFVFAGSFRSKSIDTEDVTAEFIDVGARLEAKKALEKRYTEILAKANTVNEILSIEQQLAVVREDIEATQGRLNFLSNQTEFSHITIVLNKTNKTVTGFGKKVMRALSGGWNGIQYFFSGMVYIWPFILIALVIWFLIKRRKRKKAIDLK